MERTRTNELLKNFDGKHWRSEPDNRQVRRYFPIRVQWVYRPSERTRYTAYTVPTVPRSI